MFLCLLFLFVVVVLAVCVLFLRFLLMCCSPLVFPCVSVFVVFVFACSLFALFVLVLALRCALPFALFCVSLFAFRFAFVFWIWTTHAPQTSYHACAASSVVINHHIGLSTIPNPQLDWHRVIEPPKTYFLLVAFWAPSRGWLMFNNNFGPLLGDHFSFFFRKSFTNTP